MREMRELLETPLLYFIFISHKWQLSEPLILLLYTFTALN